VSVKSRALPNAPNGYAPVHVDCPTARPSIRSASTLSSGKTAWLDTRRIKTIPALKDVFSRVEINNFDASSYIDSYASNVIDLPNIAIAISGGGMCAFLYGAGTLNASHSGVDYTWSSLQKTKPSKTVTYHCL
jgi:lysophospholipase